MRFRFLIPIDQCIQSRYQCLMDMRCDHFLTLHTGGKGSWHFCAFLTVSSDHHLCASLPSFGCVEPCTGVYHCLRDSNERRMKGWRRWR